MLTEQAIITYHNIHDLYEYLCIRWSVKVSWMPNIQSTKWGESGMLIGWRVPFTDKCHTLECILHRKGLIMGTCWLYNNFFWEGWTLKTTTTCKWLCMHTQCVYQVSLNIICLCVCLTLSPYLHARRHCIPV